MSGQDEGASALYEQAEALLSEVRELREGYEHLVGRIDEALAIDEPHEASTTDAPYHPEGASGRELYLLNLAMSGSTREDAAALFKEQFGENVDEELLERVFDRVPPLQTRKQRGRLRRRQ